MPHVRGAQTLDDGVMTRFMTPRDAALHTQAHPVLWPGDDERFAGYGVMGQPFASGHYLALRHMTASSIGPGYRTVWHRSPDGQWTFIADAPAAQSCARYFAPSAAQTVHSDIEISWDGPCSLRVVVPGMLDWRMELVSTPATTLMSNIGRRLPTALWRNDFLRRAMALGATPLLRAGRLGLAGKAVNGQSFAAAPRLIWAVSSTSAVLRGEDLGAAHPLDRQLRLGDFRLPQRGMFAVANAAFRTGAASVQNPELPGPSCGIASGADLQFGQDRRHVVVDGLDRQV